MGKNVFCVVVVVFVAVVAGSRSGDDIKNRTCPAGALFLCRCGDVLFCCTFFCCRYGGVICFCCRPWGAFAVVPEAGIHSLTGFLGLRTHRAKKQRQQKHNTGSGNE